MRTDGGNRQPVGTDGGARQGFAFTGTLFLALIVVSALAQLPAGWAPSWLRAESFSYSAIWPQKWGFFADSATTDLIFAYQPPSGGGIPVNAAISQMSRRNDWGLGRAAGGQMREIYALASEVPARSWRPCVAGTGRDCYSFGSRGGVVSLVNPFKAPTLCGPVLLVRERPQSPKARDAAIGTFGRPIEAVEVWIECSR